MSDPTLYGINAKLPEVFDHSFSGTYLECERMALYQGIWGRAGHVVDFSLMWGGVFHKLTEAWSARGDLNEIIQIIDLNLPDDIEDKYGRTKLRMQEAFIEWVKFRREDPIEVLREEQPAVVVCNGPCPYSPTGCHLTYGGRLDEIVRWNQMIGPLDFKTTVQDTGDPVTEYKPNHQMEGYVWLATHLTGHHCWGAIVERIIINKSKIKVHRFPVPYGKDQIIEWAETERLLHVEIRKKFADDPYTELVWKQNKSRCALPYKCRYRDVCTSPREAGFRLKWLRDNTVERRFDFRTKNKDREEMPNASEVPSRD
jgi:hypothetical protein